MIKVLLWNSNLIRVLTFSLLKKNTIEMAKSQNIEHELWAVFEIVFLRWFDEKIYWHIKYHKVFWIF